MNYARADDVERTRVKGYDSTMTIRTPELADILVEGLTNGIPLRQLCRENSVSKSAVYDWQDEDEAFAGRIARARVRGGHQIADECLEIADDKAEEPASRKVRIEARLKLLAKWNPKEYGDKVALTGGGPDDAPIRTESRVDVTGLTEDQLRALASIEVK